VFIPGGERDNLAPGTERDGGKGVAQIRLREAVTSVSQAEFAHTVFPPNI
jgi:hypothetical protein